MSQRNPRTTLGLALVLSLVSAIYAATSLGFKTERTDLVDPSNVHYQNWKRYSDEFGGESDIVVIVEGNDRTRMIQAIETIAREFEAHPNHFEKLCHRLRTDNLRRKGLFQLETEALRDVEAQLASFRPLLVGAWNFMTVENVVQSTLFRCEHLNATQPLDPKSRQVIGSTARMLESLAIYLDTNGSYQSPWENLFSAHPQTRLQEVPEYFFTKDERFVFLRVVPKRDTTSFEGLSAPVSIARAVVARVAPVFAGLNIGLTGIPVLEDDEMKSAQAASTSSGALSFLGVLILFFVFFQSLRRPLYVTATLVISGCLTFGWVALTIGHLNVLSVSFLVTLIGLGMDFGIIWVSQFESALLMGFDFRDANLDAANAVGPSIFVGGLTTALAFFATMVTGFLGLREMGWIAGSGIMICVATAMTVLPAILVLGGGARRVSARARRDRHAVFPWLFRHPRAIVAAMAGATLLLITQIPRLRFDYNLLNLQEHSLPSVEWEKRLIDETGTSGWHAVSIADSPAKVAELKQKFEALPSVGRVVEIASLIPADQETKAPIVKRIQEGLDRLPDSPPELFEPHAGRLAEPLDRLKVDRDLPEHEDRLALRRLAAAADFVLRTLKRISPADQELRLSQFERKWIGDLLDRLKQLRQSATPEPVTAADLPPALTSRYHGQNGQWLVQIFAKAGVWDYEPLKDFCNQVMSVDPHATGKPISTLHALEEMNQGYKHSAIFAAVLIVAAVLLDTRNLADAAFAVLPLAMGCAMMLGTLGLLGIALNPANLIGLPLIIGIGVDYGVHLVHDYHHTRGRYILSWRLGRALALCGATNILGFASLIVARHWGMASIGLVLTIGITCCTFASLLMLPALLDLRSRRRPVVTSVLPLLANPPQAAAA